MKPNAVEDIAKAGSRKGASRSERTFYPAGLNASKQLLGSCDFRRSEFLLCNGHQHSRQRGFCHEGDAQAQSTFVSWCGCRRCRRGRRARRGKRHRGCGAIGLQRFRQRSEFRSRRPWPKLRRLQRFGQRPQCRSCRSRAQLRPTEDGLQRFRQWTEFRSGRPRPSLQSSVGLHRFRYRPKRGSGGQWPVSQTDLFRFRRRSERRPGQPRPALLKKGTMSLARPGSRALTMIARTSRPRGR